MALLENQPLTEETLTDKQDVIDLLKEGEEEVQPEEKELKAEGEEEEEEEEPEIEEEEEPEVSEPSFKIFNRKQFLKDFPEAFKKYPEVEKAVYRDKQFTEAFDTPDEALEAKDKLEEFGKIEEELLTGSSKGFLGALKKSDESAFTQVVDNYMLNLREVDPTAHMHVLGNISKQIIASMWEEGKSSKDENLKAAAKILNQFLFRTDVYSPPSSFGKGEAEPENNKLKAEREAFAKEKLDNAKGQVSERLNRSVRSTIENNIDPKGQMSDYVKRNAIRDAEEEIENLVLADERFENMLEKMWEKAAKDNYSKVAMKRIEEFTKNKCKEVLPRAIQKARTEALRGLSARSKEKEDRQSPNSVERPRSSTSSTSGRVEKGKIPAGMSTRDFLNT